MKKAQFQSLAYVILFSVFLLILIIFLYNLRSEASEAGIDAACRASVKANAMLHYAAIDFSKNVKCPTKSIIITENLDSEQSQKNAKRIIANSMYSCWSQFLEGKENLFGEPNIYCAICSRINFNDKNKNLNGFSEFLIKEKIPNKEISYMDYLQGSKTKEADRVLGQMDAGQLAALKGESMPTDKEYAVIFIYAKGKNELEKLANHLTAKTLAGKTGYVGAGVSVAAGGAGLGLAALGIISNPIGWAVGIAGGVLAVTSLVSTYLLSSDNAPEWASFTLFEEYNENTLSEIGCKYLPVEQANK